MSSDTSAAASAAAPTRGTITIGGEERRLERMSARKASRVLAELRAIGKAVPEVNKVVAQFIRDYEAVNTVELDRVQARFRYPGQVLMDDETGLPKLDDTGNMVIAPSVVDTISEDDWEKAGGKLRLPKRPGWEETVLHAFPLALELAEEHVYRLLALFLMDNSDVKQFRKDGTLGERLDDRANDLLDDAFGDEVLELAVVCGELVDDQFVAKARELGDRLGNALRLVGLGPAKTSPTSTTETPEPSTDGPSSSRPTSSTDSPEDSTDGDPTTSSTSPTTSSSSSDTGSTSKPSSSKPSNNEKPPA